MNKLKMKLTALGVSLIGMITPVLSLAVDIGGVSVEANMGAAGTQQVTAAGNNILGIVTTAGIVLAVIVLIVLGVKYMMGSAEEKAEYKKTLLPYVIGAVFIFGASAIVGIISNFGGLFNP